LGYQIYIMRRHK